MIDGSCAVHMSEDNKLQAWTDASIEDGHSVGAWILQASSGRALARGTADFGREGVTGNTGEYGAVLDLLERVLALGYQDRSLTVHSDSKLVVEQLNDNWRCNNEKLKEIRDKIWKLLENFTEKVEFVWIPREENKEADELSRSLYGAK